MSEVLHVIWLAVQVVLELLGILLIVAMAWVPWDEHVRPSPDGAERRVERQNATDAEQEDYEATIRRLRELEDDAARRLHDLRRRQ